MATTYTRPCRRCNGTGFYGNRGFCFNCQGAMVVEITRYTPEEKAERKRFATRRMAAYEAIVRPRHEWVPVEDRIWIHTGFDYLETKEPDRFRKMLDSIDAGRMRDVVFALINYGKSHAS